jgi:hypothetical protein
MINVVFPEIGTKIAEQHPQKGLTNLILQIDNAPCQNSKQATAEIQKLRLSKKPLPICNPNLSPCDSWFFGFLKEKLQGTQHRSSRQLLDAILAILVEIQKVILLRCIKIRLRC